MKERNSRQPPQSDEDTTREHQDFSSKPRDLDDKMQQQQQQQHHGLRQMDPTPSGSYSITGILSDQTPQHGLNGNTASSSSSFLPSPPRFPRNLITRL